MGIRCFPNDELFCPDKTAQKVYVLEFSSSRSAIEPFQDDKGAVMGVAESTVYNDQPYFWPFQDAAPAREEVRRSSQSSDKVDVLIVGAGPSGCVTSILAARGPLMRPAIRMRLT